MARTPAIPEADYSNIVRLIAEQGYDTSKLRHVPQHWPLHVVEEGQTP